MNTANMTIDQLRKDNDKLRKAAEVLKAELEEWKTDYVGTCNAMASGEIERLKAELVQAKTDNARLAAEVAELNQLASLKLSRTRIKELQAENARIAKVISVACDQLKRGEWTSHTSGTWTMLNDQLTRLRGLTNTNDSDKTTT